MYLKNNGLKRGGKKAVSRNKTAETSGPHAEKLNEHPGKICR